MSRDHDELDLLGEVCPVPLLKTEKAVNNLSSEQPLEIITDHTQAVRNIMEFLEDRSLEFEVEELKPGIWKIKLKEVEDGNYDG